MDVTEARIAQKLAKTTKPGQPWPQGKDSFFTGFLEPLRFEGTVDNLVVEGEVPIELYGTLFRICPENQFAPRYEDEEWFGSDGSMVAFRFKDGSVDFEKRFIQTEKYLKEKAAKRALYGYYGNPWSALPDIGTRDETTNLSTANTNVIFHNDTGLLYALEELNPPHLINPFTLETIGKYDFEGTLPSFTMTAHPKYDYETGELVCFSNEADGHCSTKLFYFTVGKNGKITESLWFDNPCGAVMIHDCVVTTKYIILVLIPQAAELEWNKQCNKHWAWKPDMDLVFGCVPRHAPTEDEVKWFHFDNAFAGHTSNGFDLEDGRVVIDTTYANENCLPWYPTKEGHVPDLKEIEVKFSRFTIDPKLPGKKHGGTMESLQRHSGEFPRIDDRFQTKPYSMAFIPALDPLQPTDLEAVLEVAGPTPFFNCMTKVNVVTKEKKSWFAGTHHGVLEPVFVARNDKASEADGWLMFIRNCYDTMTSDLVVMDTHAFEDGPVAIIKLPFRLRPGFHGNWVDGKRLDSFKSKYEAK